MALDCLRIASKVPENIFKFVSIVKVDNVIKIVNIVNIVDSVNIVDTVNFVNMGSQEISRDQKGYQEISGDIKGNLGLYWSYLGVFYLIFQPDDLLEQHRGGPPETAR